MNPQKKSIVIALAIVCSISLFLVLHGVIKARENAQFPEYAEAMKAMPPQDDQVNPVQSTVQIPDDALEFAKLARKYPDLHSARALGKPDKVQQRDNGYGYGANIVSTTLYFEKTGGTVAVRFGPYGASEGVDVL